MQFATVPFPLLVKQELIKLGYKLCKNHLPIPINKFIKRMEPNHTNMIPEEKKYQLYINTLIHI